jgi:hypothetical protein
MAVKRRSPAALGVGGAPGVAPLRRRRRVESSRRLIAAGMVALANRRGARGRLWLVGSSQLRRRQRFPSVADEGALGRTGHDHLLLGAVPELRPPQRPERQVPTESRYRSRAVDSLADEPARQDHRREALAGRPRGAARGGARPGPPATSRRHGSRPVSGDASAPARTEPCSTR